MTNAIIWMVRVEVVVVGSCPSSSAGTLAPEVRVPVTDFKWGGGCRPQKGGEFWVWVEGKTANYPKDFEEHDLEPFQMTSSALCILMENAPRWIGYGHHCQ